MNSLRQMSMRRMSFRGGRTAEVEITKGRDGGEEPSREEVTFLRADLEKWKAMFDQVAGKKGYIDLVEFRVLVDRSTREAGAPPRDDEWVVNAFRRADTSGDGHVDFKEFVAVQYAQKASVDKMVESHAYEANPRDVRYAEIAARNVQSVAILRETLEKARRNAKDPKLAAEAERLLFAMGATGLPEKAKQAHESLVTQMVETAYLSSAAPKDVKGKGRRNYAAYGELAAQMAGNMVDAQAVEAQLEQQQQIEAAQAAQQGAEAPPRNNFWSDLGASLPHGHDLDQVLSFFQYTSLTNQIAKYFAAAWPSYNLGFEIPELFVRWQFFMGWMNIFNLDLRAIAAWAARFGLPDWFQAFANLPFPSLYLLVTAVVPLLISFIILLIEYPLSHVLWIFITVFSVVIVASVAVATEQISETRLQVIAGGAVSPLFLDIMLYIGLGLLGLMLLLAALHFWWGTYRQLVKTNDKLDKITGAIDRMEKSGRQDVMGLQEFVRTQKQRHHRNTYPPCYNFGIYVRNYAAMVTCFFFFFADLLWPAIFKFGIVLKLVLILGGFLLLIGNILSSFGYGRFLLRKGKMFFDRWAVTGFLLLLSILYMPITRLLFSVWLPVELSCPAGEWFPEYANQLSSAESQWLAREDYQCETCAFFSHDDYKLDWKVRFETAGECVAHFCRGETSIRSFEDPRLDYREMILPFFGVSSALTIIGFTMGVPLLYWVLVYKHTEVLEAGVDVHQSRAQIRTIRNLFSVIHTQDVHWDYRVSMSNNRAKSLYSIFEYRFRYMKLFIILQKLFLILIVIFLTNFLVAAAIAVACLHFIILGITIATRPFFDPKSNALGIAISFASACNPLIIVLTYYGALNVAPTELVSWLIIVVNFVFPLLALCVGCFFSVRRKRVLNSQEEKIDKELSEAERLKQLADRQVLDDDLDEITLTWVLRVFVAMTLTGFISIAFLAFGQFWAAAQTNVVAPTLPNLGENFAELYAECRIEDLVKSNELVQYSDWRNFTANCCCMDRQSKESYGEDFEPNVVELWACNNGFYKERYRAGALGIREFCSPVFNKEFSEPVYDASRRQMVVYKKLQQQEVLDGELVATEFEEAIPFGW